MNWGLQLVHSGDDKDAKLAIGGSMNFSDDAGDVAASATNKGTESDVFHVSFSSLLTPLLYHTRGGFALDYALFLTHR